MIKLEYLSSLSNQHVFLKTIPLSGCPINNHPILNLDISIANSFAICVD
jgi:hypothetical protein